jgi:hypothetical protein
MVVSPPSPPTLKAGYPDFKQGVYPAIHYRKNTMQAGLPTLTRMRVGSTRP